MIMKKMLITALAAVSLMGSAQLFGAAEEPRFIYVSDLERKRYWIPYVQEMTIGDLRRRYFEQAVVDRRPLYNNDFGKDVVEMVNLTYIMNDGLRRDDDEVVMEDTAVLFEEEPRQELQRRRSGYYLLFHPVNRPDLPEWPRPVLRVDPAENRPDEEDEGGFPMINK